MSTTLAMLTPCGDEVAIENRMSFGFAERILAVKSVTVDAVVQRAVSDVLLSLLGGLDKRITLCAAVVVLPDPVHGPWGRLILEDQSVWVWIVGGYLRVSAYEVDRPLVKHL